MVMFQEMLFVRVQTIYVGGKELIANRKTFSARKLSNQVDIALSRPLDCSNTRRSVGLSATLDTATPGERFQFLNAAAVVFLVNAMHP